MLSARSSLEYEVEYLRKELDRCQRDKYDLEVRHASYVRTRKYEQEIMMNPMTPHPMASPLMHSLEVRRHSHPAPASVAYTPKNIKTVAADEVLQAVLTSEGSPLMWNGNPALSPMLSSPPNESSTSGDLTPYEAPKHVHWHSGVSSPPL